MVRYSNRPLSESGTNNKTSVYVMISIVSVFIAILSFLLILSFTFKGSESNINPLQQSYTTPEGNEAGGEENILPSTSTSCSSNADCSSYGASYVCVGGECILSTGGGGGAPIDNNPITNTVTGFFAKFTGRTVGTRNDISYNDGFVGIGTTTPSTMFDVNGIIQSSGCGSQLSTSTGLSFCYGGGTSYLNSINHTEGYPSLNMPLAIGKRHITFNAANNTNFVGIGTWTPYEALDVNGVIRSVGCGPSGYKESGAGLGFCYGGGSSWLVSIDHGNKGSVDELKPFHIRGSPITLNAAGSGSDRVGIGTWSPRTTLEVNGNITVSNLAGTGNGYVCVDATGKLYRSPTACA